MSQHIAIVANQAIITDTLDGFFKVSTMFNRDLVEFYRTLPTRKWCSEHKFWRFPLTHLEAIVKELNHRGYVVIRKTFDRLFISARRRERKLKFSAKMTSTSTRFYTQWSRTDEIQFESYLLCRMIR